MAIEATFSKFRKTNLIIYIVACLGFGAWLAYDGYMVIADAFQRARNVLKTPLMRALGRTKDLQGVTGTLSFNSHGDAQKTGIVMETMADSSRFRARIKM